MSPATVTPTGTLTATCGGLSKTINVLAYRP
jgi:hypothetical protein